LVKEGRNHRGEGRKGRTVHWRYVGERSTTTEWTKGKKEGRMEKRKDERISAFPAFATAKNRELGGRENGEGEGEGRWKGVCGFVFFQYKYGLLKFHCAC
jgi:hypothetical protein